VIVESLRARNFRSIRDETLHCDDLTSLVGANGVGKSSFLRALELFYNPTPRVSEDDFYAGDTSNELVVAVTYAGLSESAVQLFEKYIQNSTLTVERVFIGAGGRANAKYFGATLRHDGFQGVRLGLEIKDRGRTARSAYDSLRMENPYRSLPAWTTLAAVPEALSAWEAKHPGNCTRHRDDGQFFGFNSVAQGYLGRYTRLLYMPAVRDAASDAEEGRGSVLSSLMDLVVRRAIANKPAFIRLQERSQRLYERVLDPSRLQELKGLGDELTSTLRSFVPDAAVDLRWLPLESISMPMPQADIHLIEDGYPSAVERTGHGLQRAFIITMLQHLTVANDAAEGPTSVARASEESAKEGPNLVLAIEEPELYQHPSRQRHFARTLALLASGAAQGVAKNTQVIYATHSPLFVSVDRIHQIRLLRRVGETQDLPKVTRVVRTSLSEVADTLWEADGSPEPKYTAHTLLPRLRTIMTPWMSEGFFAEVAVLVEGEDDRAALLGVSQVLGYDLESWGFAIIPCGGKTSLDRPFVIFTKLGIPAFLVWDGDKGSADAKPADNHRLLRLLKQPVVDWPATIGIDHACFETDLETTLRAEIGASVYDSLLAEAQKDLGIPKRKHAQKNPSVIARIIENAQQQACNCGTLETIAKNIRAMRA
jgi:putative ATP-dependent endonuclease of OLD family